MKPDQIIFKILNPLLDRIPSGWKSIVGLLGILTLMVLKTLGKIDEETFQQYYGWATILFGVGVIHKQLTEKKPE